MKKICSCGGAITKVWESRFTPMPPGFGACPQEEIIIWGSCGNNTCQPVALGQFPFLTLQAVRQELGLQEVR